jgi:hypothetical protein
LRGPSSIAKTFKQKGYYYSIVREEGLGHEVSVLPMYEQLPIVLDFLNAYIIASNPTRLISTLKILARGLPLHFQQNTC